MINFNKLTKIIFNTIIHTQGGIIMEIINLDFNRIISSKEILNISEENYNNIIKYSNVINNRYERRVSNKQFAVTFKLYKTYNTELKKRINQYELSDNKNDSVYYLMNAVNNYTRNLSKKEREIIACNFLINNDEIFSNVLTSSIMTSSFEDINDLYTEINYLCDLRDEDPKKFKFLLPRLKLEERLLPILKAFIKYYNISDINIILNKITLMNTNREKNKTLQMVKDENN
jgi:hypothetical protein